jgi:hypothetical protein
VPQIVLDPADAEYTAARNWKPNRPLLKDVIDFGFVPDIDALRPGDLLLFTAVKPSLIQRCICWAQSGQFHDDHARWHHVAMYIGRGRICEATILEGVRIAEIYNYIPGSVIRVRRCPKLAADDEGARDVAFEALSRLGRRYSIETLWRILKRMRLKNLPRPYAVAATRPTHVCSGLYADAFTQSSMRVVCNGGGGIPTPADLSITDILEDVKIEWLRLIH